MKEKLGNPFNNVSIVDSRNQIRPNLFSLERGDWFWDDECLLFVEQSKENHAECKAFEPLTRRVVTYYADKFIERVDVEIKIISR